MASVMMSLLVLLFFIAMAVAMGVPSVILLPLTVVCGMFGAIALFVAGVARFH